MRMNKETEKLVSILMVLLIAIGLSLPQTAKAGVVSDFFGLEGPGATMVDGGVDIVLSGAGFGGAVFDLGNAIYDTGKSLVTVGSGNGTTMDYIDLGINAAAAGAIIAGIATGGAAIPVIVAVSVGVKVLKTVVKHLSAIDKVLGGIRNTVGNWLKKHIGNPILNLLGVYKPNIYLYSERDMTVRVMLEPNEWITASDPVYDPADGWSAVIINGSLNGRNGYLFYEAQIPDSGLQRREGFTVSGGSLETDMRNILSKYGFNQTETEDFLNYWSEKLDPGKNYLFYPQCNGIIDRIMPLTVEPEPDQLFRVWFLIEEDDGRSVYREISGPEPIRREGFTVVEWGGVCGASMTDGR